MIRPRSTANFEGLSFAQNFEDLIARSLFDEFSSDEIASSKSVVDIGASDGVTLSNSRLFVESGYQALLVDADDSRYKKCVENSKLFGNCSVSNVYVTNSNCLQLLSQAGIDEIGILSIDIDGLDLLILKTTIPYNPKIVIIEYNPTIPLHIDFEQQPTHSNLGNSALAIFNYMASRGYFLRAATQTNLIFSKKPGFQKFELKDLLNDDETVKGIWVGYNGEIVIDGRPYLEFPWHGLDQRIRISGIPKTFRVFYGGGNKSHFKAKIWSKFSKFVNFRDRVVSRISQL